MAYFDTTWYVNFGDGSTTGYYAVAKRPQNAAVAAGQIVRQFTTPAVGSERAYICRNAGTTANTTDATWTLTRGAQVVDGTVTWSECTGMAAVNGDIVNTPSWADVKALGTSPSLGVIIKRNNLASYQVCTTAGTLGAVEPAFSDTAGTSTAETSATATWRSLGPVGNFTGGQAPHARLGNALASTWFTSGNTVYVGNNHAETGTSILLTTASALMAKIICHNSLGAYPPASGDITTGASITSIGALGINGQGSFYFYGLTFKASVPANLSIGAASVGQVQNWYYFDNCLLDLRTGTGGSVFGASSTAWGIIVLNNTTIRNDNVGAFIIPYFVNLTWQNTGQILAVGSSVPTTLFQQSGSSGRFNTTTLNNLDLSQLTGSLFTNAANSSIGTLIVQDCKLNAAMTVTTPINTGMNVQLIRSDSAGTSYKSTRYAYEGIETTETSIVRTGGAVDPIGQAQSRKLVTSANAQWLRPFKAEPMVIWNPTTGANVTATVYGTVNAGALPNNDDLWLECEYLGSATDPLGKTVTTTKSSVLASNAAVASDSSVWGTPATSFDGLNTLVALSNGNLTVTHNNTTINAGAMSTAFLIAGKYYFEMVIQTSLSNSTYLGIVSSAFSGVFSTSQMSTNSTTAGTGATTTINSNGVLVGGIDLGTTAVGDVFCFAIDLTARLAWIRRNSGNWNASGAANPSTGVGGVTIQATVPFAPIVRFPATGGSIVDAVTANFGASAFAFTAPSGFLGWDTGWTPFKLTTTLSSPQPQLPGYLHARVRAAKLSTTYYIDPKVELT